MADIEVKKIRISDVAIAVNPLGDRKYALAKDLLIQIEANVGLLEMFVKAGAVSNFRSGGVLVDCFIDQIGDSTDIQALYIFHDFCYTPMAARGMQHPVSRKFADQILRAGLIYAKMPKWKANAVYYSVRTFGHWAYEEDDELTARNCKLFTFNWKSSFNA